ncbi:MAG: universal stress protein [Polyangiaceae bacterium]
MVNQENSSDVEDSNAQQPLLNTDDEPRTVLAAVDTSPSSARVISTAARFVRAFPAAALHVLHVARSSRLDHARVGVPSLGSDALEDAKEHLAYHVRLARSQCRNAITGHFLTGDPTGEILRSCLELKADMLVIATNDHAGFERLLLGSIAERLMRKAPCSVVVVRPRGAH